MEAALATHAYRPHRHDSYAIGLTMSGVQCYRYRQVRRVSLPGEVVVLHPDEVHDGEAGTEAGLYYRMVYLDPAAVRDALGEDAKTLPFIRDGHSPDRRLAAAVGRAVADLRRPLEPLASDAAVLDIATSLLALDPGARTGRGGSSGASAAVRRARAVLDEAGPATVTGQDLEQASGLDRFDLARQFRRAFGISPHRYHLRRRLERARRMMADPRESLAEIAVATGFADQAHFSRQFNAAFGFSPGLWRRLAAHSYGSSSVSQ